MGVGKQTDGHDITVSPTKADKPIEMSFGFLTQVGPKNHVWLIHYLPENAVSDKAILRRPRSVLFPGE